MSMRIRFARAAVAAGLLGCATGITLGVAFAGVDDAAVKIDNFTFTPKSVTVKAGTTVTWTNQDDIPHTVNFDHQAVQIQATRHRRQVHIHVHDTGHIRIFLLLASAYDRNHRGRGGDGGWRHPMMQGLRRQSE